MKFGTKEGIGMGKFYLDQSFYCIDRRDNTIQHYRLEGYDEQSNRVKLRNTRYNVCLECSEYELNKVFFALYHDAVEQLQKEKQQDEKPKGRSLYRVTEGSVVVLHNYSTNQREAYVLLGAFREWVSTGCGGPYDNNYGYYKWSSEIDIDANHISTLSPLGQELLDKKKDEVFTFRNLEGKVMYRILEIYKYAS